MLPRLVHRATLSSDPSLIIGGKDLPAEVSEP
jgi:hypothetical protein